MLNYLEKNKAIPIAITILIALTIFYLSTFKSVPAGILTSKINLAYVYHFGIFLLFTFFLTIWVKGNNKLNLKYFLIIFLISIFYAISDEIHQIFVPGRFGSVTDFLIDGIGSMFSVVVYFFVDRS